MSPNPWVRPYVLTGGRTRTKHQLYERAYLGTQSVAELSAFCGISLGVTRVLLEDLAATEQVQINDEIYASPYDHRLLKRVIDGLREFA